MDVFDTTDFNPELILSSVLLDAGFDIVANIEELSDNMVTNDLMQQIGSSAVYAEAPAINAATSSNTSISSMHGVEDASQHFLHLANAAAAAAATTIFTITARDCINLLKTAAFG
ncbi:hypothetical protein AND_008219 [Anopheles darlingi]|uniref:Uncharacterized protein n=1 Tax=Anopheles darlingi TaxID=43151 RepID=W5J9U2_ANODA|nr:hypothetical protein AND_008219 [Anopheles darlingi]